MSRKVNFMTQVPTPSVPRNLFDLTHEVKMSGKFGYLYPVLLMDCLPGDTIRDQMTAMVRFAPMLSPIMHRCDVKTDFFFVPNRLVTDHWETFITGGQDGQQSETVTLPYLTPYGFRLTINSLPAMQKGSLWDYLGLPPVLVDPGAQANWDNTQQISVLPFRAYCKIWNDFFRDPNLDDEVDLDLETQGDVSSASSKWTVLRRRGWERDYFTAALPFAQRGEQVLLPLAGTGTATVDYLDIAQLYQSAGGTVAAGNLTTFVGGAPGAPTSMRDSTNQTLRLENIDSIDVAIDGATTTINDFRLALALQRWMENNARGGARYIEQIQSHFNVRVPDYRLQRAEYLGGGRQAVQISEVLSTAEGTDVPVGDMAGHGISVGKSNRFTYRCQEHGFLMGIMTIIPRTAYSQGIDRMWTRRDKFDYAWPELAHLGEQEIISKEIFYSFNVADAAENEETFGYIPRFAEYKFKNDRLAGDFRTTLDFWHLGRIFTSRPQLDSDFVMMEEHDAAYDDTYRRIFAVQDGTDYLWVQLFHNLTAKRPLPYFGVPTLKG